MTEQFTTPDRAPDYSDRFAGPIANPKLSAKELLAAALDAAPPWFAALFALRQGVARVIGLKTAGAPGTPLTGLRFFETLPVLNEDDGCYELGVADRHLDFALRVEKTGAGDVAVTTDIWINGALGRIYLAFVLPVHRLAVRGFVDSLAGKPA